MKRTKKKFWLGLIVGLIPIVWIVMLIDDWSRDFTTNYAVTSVHAEDPRLRPVMTELSSSTVSETLVAWVAGKRAWQMESTETDATGVVRMHLVRTTFVFGFKDDIHVTIKPSSSSGSTVTAESRSRIGKGDLGQNPRNLRELLDAIR